jgi:hypothetical protein
VPIVEASEAAGIVKKSMDAHAGRIIKGEGAIAHVRIAVERLGIPTVTTKRVGTHEST